MKTVLRLIFLLPLLLPLNLRADMPRDAVYLDGNGSKFGLILCHGRGKHPTWKVVEPLRHGVHDKLGWHTLSLQMPAEDKSWKQYADDFPAAYASITQAINFLRNQGVEKVFLMGHSMGSRMASAYVANNADHGIDGLIVAGIRNNGPSPLDGDENLRKTSIPVLDIWGDANGKDSRAASERRDLVSARYQQIPVEGANHKFDDHEEVFVNAVVRWLRQQAGDQVASLTTNRLLHACHGLLPGIIMDPVIRHQLHQPVG